MEKEVTKEEFNLKFGEVTRIGGQGAVKSVNGQVGDVILTTSDIENTSGYQDKDEVAAAIGHATETLQGEIDDLSADKQDKLTAGENITIEGNVISAAGSDPVNVVQSTGDSTEDVMSQKAVTDALNSVGGGVKELTADDYNAPASNPTAVALALLEPGVYVWKNGVNVRVGEGGSNLVYNDGRSAIVGYGNTPSGSSLRKIVFIFGGASNNSSADVPMKICTMAENLWTEETSKSILTNFSIVNVLTSTSTSRPLSANQGKVLNDKITALEARVAALEGN